MIPPRRLSGERQSDRTTLSGAGGLADGCRPSCFRRTGGCRGIRRPSNRAVRSRPEGATAGRAASEGPSCNERGRETSSRLCRPGCAGVRGCRPSKPSGRLRWARAVLARWTPSARWGLTRGPDCHPGSVPPEATVHGARTFPAQGRPRGASGPPPTDLSVGDLGGRRPSDHSFGSAFGS